MTNNQIPITKYIKKFLHMDLYRLTGKDEYKEIDFIGQFVEGTVACIEWPENMGEENLRKLKEKCRVVSVNFEYVDERTREIAYSF